MLQRPADDVGQGQAPDAAQGMGVGRGSKGPEACANGTRVGLGEVADQPVARQQGEIGLLETNLDDATGKVLGYAQDRLFALGALDVWCAPIQMKKNRPGVILSALVPQYLESAAVDVILRETTTLGVRSRPIERYVAERRSAGRGWPQPGRDHGVAGLGPTARAAGS